MRVRVMVCYVLRPSPDNGYFGSRCSGCLFGRYAQGGVDQSPALRVCLRRLALRCSFPSAPVGLPKKSALAIRREWVSEKDMVAWLVRRIIAEAFSGEARRWG
jgi:hypothetical protein